MLGFRIADGRKIELVQRSDGQGLIYRCQYRDKVLFAYEPSLKDSACSFFSSRYFRPNQNDRDGLDFQYVWFFQGGFRYLIYALSYESEPFQFGIRIKNVSNEVEVDLPASIVHRQGLPFDLFDQPNVCGCDTIFD